MNSDHVQRYHIRQDGYIFGVSYGEWIKVRDVKQFTKCLQRYENDDNPTCYGLQPYNQGEWVRYEDVKHLIKEDQCYD